MGGLIHFPDAEAALDRRLDDDSAAPLVLALSGGGDSMALLHLAADWTRRRGRKLLALTVDHHLNPDSAAWTRIAADTAKSVGADWRALHWLGEKPSTGMPAAARAARHRLLADATREAGCGVILFAHTADDVAESAAMRAQTPSLGYLREWSPSPVWPEGRGVFALRPLLSARRDDLRAFLHARGQGWIDDPANHDMRFARTRARAELAAAPDSAAALASRDESALCDLARASEQSADGRIIIQRSAWERTGRASARRFLSIAVICASGRSAPPRGGALDRVMAQMHPDATFIVTLAGARITVNAETAMFSREPGDMARSGLSRLALQPGQSAVWDGRFEITAEAPLTVAPMAGSAARLSKVDRTRLAEIPASARPALPVLLHDDHAALPAPFSDGPAFARPLSGARLGAACGLVAHERDISPPTEGLGMAQTPRSSYVEALALA